MDIRHAAARYYDLLTPDWDDVAFYVSLLPAPGANVLELGCGTGRVLAPMAAACGSIVGLDQSEAMLEVCRRRIEQAGVANATVQQADITRFDVGQSFDLITAPFRVIQNLATDAQVAGLLDCIRGHLAPGGVAVLNAFNPKWPRDELITQWGSSEERGREAVETPEGLVVCTEIWQQIDTDPLVLHPELIYRLERDGKVADETRLHIDMRVWYPDEFADLIEAAGFAITGKWGGYEGEAYGSAGEELVIAFTDAAAPS